MLSDQKPLERAKCPINCENKEIARGLRFDASPVSTLTPSEPSKIPPPLHDCRVYPVQLLPSSHSQHPSLWILIITPRLGNQSLCTVIYRPRSVFLYFFPRFVFFGFIVSIFCMMHRAFVLLNFSSVTWVLLALSGLLSELAIQRKSLNKLQRRAICQDFSF